MCKEWQFTSFLIWIPLISLSSLLAMARISKTMLNKSGKSEYPCLIADLRGNSFSFSILRVMLAVALSYMTFTMLKSVFSIQFSCSVVSDPLLLYGLQFARLPWPSPTPRVYSNLCPLSQWCQPTISSSIIPISSWFQLIPASRSFPMSQLFKPGCQRIGVSASASIYPTYMQD